MARFTIKDVLNSKAAKNNPHIIEGVAVKCNKFLNKKTLVDGEEIDSIKEANRYKELKLDLKFGGIMFLARQVEFTFHIEGNKIASYFADFVYIYTRGKDVGKLIVEDVKSPKTRKLPAYRLKKKMMFIQHKIKIKET